MPQVIPSLSIPFAPRVFAPTNWAFSRTKWTVAIVPRTASKFLRFFFLPGIPAVGLAIGIWTDQLAIAIAALFLGVCAWLALRTIDRARLGRGSWFVFRLADGIVELPRLNVSVPRSHRKEFQVVSYTQTGGPRGVELNLIAWGEDGNPSRYPLVGDPPRALGSGEVDRLASALSKATAIPVRRRQCSGEREECLCEKCGGALRPTADRCSECGHPFLVVQS